MRYAIFWILLQGALTGLLPINGQAAEPSFDVPEGLTLQAKSAGRYLLLWEPINSENLMGYSVWLRRKGEKEFVRLSVPVKVGKEIQKQSMVSEAKLELKLGEGRKDLEFAVVAEYEAGPSERSESVFSARASQVLALPAAGTPEASSGTAKTVSPSAAGPEEAAQPWAGDTAPWDQRSGRLARPLLSPPGKFHSSFGASFEIIRSIYSGRDVFASLGLIGTTIPYTKVVDWRRVDTRTRFRVPLRAEYGLLPDIELWAEGSYNAEDVSINTYSVDGQDFSYIRPVVVRPDGSLFYLPDPSSTGFGDSSVGLRLSPIPKQPLVLQGWVSLPTGKSRVKADLDYESALAFAAGTGEGITRFWGRIDWGWRGLRPGPSLYVAFSPGAAERQTQEQGGVSYQHVVTHGDIGEAGVGYTVPWRVLQRDGALVFLGTVRSIEAARWTVNGVDIVPFTDKIERSRLAAETGLKFNRDDQLELGIEALQDLPRGFETGGRLSYTSGIFGDQIMISGRLVY